VAQGAAQAGKRVRVQTAVPLDAVPGTRRQLIECPARLRDADDWEIEVTVFGQRLKGRKYLLVSQVSGRPEEHQRIGPVVTHRSGCLFPSAWRPIVRRGRRQGY